MKDVGSESFKIFFSYCKYKYQTSIIIVYIFNYVMIIKTYMSFLIH